MGKAQEMPPRQRTRGGYKGFAQEVSGCSGPQRAKRGRQLDLASSTKSRTCLSRLKPFRWQLVRKIVSVLVERPYPPHMHTPHHCTVNKYAAISLQLKVWPATTTQQQQQTMAAAMCSSTAEQNFDSSAHLAPAQHCLYRAVAEL